jgi:hypothetical protein
MTRHTECVNNYSCEQGKPCAVGHQLRNCKEHWRIGAIFLDVKVTVGEDHIRIIWRPSITKCDRGGYRQELCIPSVSI